MTLLATFLATFVCPAAEVPAPRVPSLLSGVPETAHVLVWCQDVAALRDRLERNRWAKLLASEQCAPLRVSAGEDYQDSTGLDLQHLIDVGLAVRGEALLFADGECAGFLTSPTEDGGELAAAMRAWLPEGAPVVGEVASIAGAQVQAIGWPGDLDYDLRGHVAAFVSHPEVLGLFSANDLGALNRGLRASLAGFAPGSGGERRAPAVQGLLSARASHGKPGAIEAWIDFSPAVAKAQTALENLAQGRLEDPPENFLGLDGGAWLYLTADADADRRVEVRGHFEIPPGGLTASLADTFGPLPADLLGDVPRATWGLIALQWDVGELYTRARAAVLEAGGEEALKPLDQGLEAAEAMGGVDVEREIIAQIAGPFTLMFEGEELSIGALVGLHDGEAFAEAFETLVGGFGVYDRFDSEELAGADAYLFDDESIPTGGFAFLPQAFVFGLERAQLDGILAARGGGEGSSLLDAQGDLAAAFDGSQGACFFAAVELAPWVKLILQDEGVESPEEEVAAIDGELTAAVRRVARGFDLEVGVR